MGIPGHCRQTICISISREKEKGLEKQTYFNSLELFKFLNFKNSHSEYNCISEDFGLLKGTGCEQKSLGHIEDR